VRANLKSIFHRYHLFELAFVWKLSQEIIHLPLGCLQGGFPNKIAIARRSADLVGASAVGGVRQRGARLALVRVAIPNRDSIQAQRCAILEELTGVPGS